MFDELAVKVEANHPTCELKGYSVDIPIPDGGNIRTQCRLIKHFLTSTECHN